MTSENQPIDKKQYTIEIHFETILNKAFSNYKKIALYAGLALFVFFFIFIMTATTLSVYFIGEENINEKSMMQFQKLLLTKPYLWYYNGFSILLGSLLTPFMAGFFKMADAAENDYPFGISHLFSFYTSSHFFPLFGSSFLISFTTNILNIFFEEIGLPFIGVILILVINFFTLLTIPLIIFGNFSALAAIQASVFIIKNQPLVIFLLIAVSIIAVMLGLFAFCIGILFTYPFLIAMLYTICNELKNK